MKQIPFYLKPIVAVLMLSFLSCTDNPPKSVTQKEDKTGTAFSDLNALCDTLEKYDQWMGSVLILKNDEVLYERYLGFRAQDAKGNPIPNDKNTRFRIASVTKTYTAVLIMQLVEEGKLHLETKLSEYLPQIPESDKISIEHLLAHQSGIHDFINDLEMRPDQGKETNREETLQRIIQTPRDFEPGEKSAYSNPNYMLLGYIIEDLSGNSFEAELNKRIIQALGLKETKFGSSILVEQGYAHSYAKEGKEWKQADVTHMSVPFSAGGITASAQDLALFVSALFDGKLLKEETLEKMKTPRGKYALGMQMRILPGANTIYVHSGAMNQFFAKYAYFPKQGITIVSNSNGYNVEPDLVFMAAINSLLKQPVVLPEFATIELGPEQAKRLEGIYHNEKKNLELKIQFRGQDCFATLSGQPEFEVAIKSETLLTLDKYNVKLHFENLLNDRFQSLRLEQNEPLVFIRVDQE